MQDYQNVQTNQEKTKGAKHPDCLTPVITKKEATSPKFANSIDHKRSIARNQKKANTQQRFFSYLVLTLFLSMYLILLYLSSNRPTKSDLAANNSNEAAAVTSQETKALPEAVDPHYFTYSTADGQLHPIDLQELANAWAAEAGETVRYSLTDAERYEIAQVVTAEAATEPLAGKMAICQCILLASEKENIRPSQAVIAYKYTKNRPKPTKEALTAVQYVFDFGIMPTSEPILYFYNPALVKSEFHESQQYVMTINNHRFFAEQPTK